MVGRDVRPTMPAEVVPEALRRTLGVRQPAPGLVAHLGQGSQYAPDVFGQLLTQHQALASRRRKGNCSDNAHAESFRRRRKTELRGGGNFPDQETARLEISHYVAYYNLKRRHPAFDHQTPAGFETHFSTKPQRCSA